MKKQVIVTCHGRIVSSPSRSFWHRDVHLSPEGVRQVRKASEYFEQHRICIAASSTVNAAAETAVELLRDSIMIELTGNLAPSADARWDALRAYGDDIAPAFTEHAAFLQEEGDRIAHAIHWYSGRIAPGQRALIVTHPLLADLAIARVVKQWPPVTRLQEGEFCALAFEGEHVTAHSLSVA